MRNLHMAKTAGSDSELPEHTGIGANCAAFELGALPWGALQPFARVGDVLPSRNGSGVSAAKAVAQHATESDRRWAGCGGNVMCKASADVGCSSDVYGHTAADVNNVSIFYKSIFESD